MISAGWFIAGLMIGGSIGLIVGGLMNAAKGEDDDIMSDAIDSWKQLRQRDRLMTVDDVVSYDTCVEREQAAFDAALDKALEVISECKFTDFDDKELALYDNIAVHNRALDAAHTAVNELRKS